MSRWLAPLVGVVGLLALVVGVVWADLDMSTMGGVQLAGAGVVLVLAATVLAASVDVSTRRRDALPRCASTSGPGRVPPAPFGGSPRACEG